MQWGGDKEFVSKVDPGEKRGVGEGVPKIWVYFLLSHSDLIRNLSLVQR